MDRDFIKHGQEEPGLFEGQLLIAMPGMEDPRFARAVIYMCSHSVNGAMGIVINRPADHFSFPELLMQLNVIPSDEALVAPEHLNRIKVMVGGPVEGSQGFVLHTPDYQLDGATMTIDDGVCLTATVDILRAIARGAGPRHAILALGYAGWGAGQLESEIQANSWLTCPASPDLLFRSAVELRYDMALRSIGVSLEQLSSAAGRA